jgi:hypothetical protein
VQKNRIVQLRTRAPPSPPVVSWLPHAVVPGLFALAFFRRLPRPWVLALLPVVWVQDMDYFVGGTHRALTHNVWIPLAFLLGAVWLWRQKDPAAPFLAFASKPGWALALLLCGYYTASHVFLDVFAGGVVLFWPLSDLNFYWHYEIVLDLRSGDLTPVQEVGTEQGVPEVSDHYTWFSTEHAALAAFLLACALVGLAAWLWRRRRPVAASIHKGQEPPPGR